MVTYDSNKLKNKYPDNVYLQFACQMQNKPFRDKNGPALCMIIPGNFNVLITFGKKLGYVFTEGEVKEILNEIKENELEGISEQAAKYMIAWISKCC